MTLPSRLVLAAAKGSGPQSAKESRRSQPKKEVFPPAFFSFLHSRLSNVPWSFSLQLMHRDQVSQNCCEHIDKQS